MHVDDHYFDDIIPIFIQRQQLESISLQLNILDREDIKKIMGILAKNIPKNLNNLVLMIYLKIYELKAFFSQFDGILKLFGFNMLNLFDSSDALIIEI